MGKRRGRRNNGGGGGGGGNKTTNSNQNKRNSTGHLDNQMELEVASQFPPQQDATENEDDFFASEIVEDILAEAMYRYMMDGRELDEESFMNFFLENYMAKLLVECEKNQHHGRPNADFGSHASSDDDDDGGVDFDIRFSTESPSYSYKKKRPSAIPKRKSNKKKKKGHSDDQVAFETLIKMLIIQCILEEKSRRNKRFGWKSISIFVLIAASFIYYWWH